MALPIIINDYNTDFEDTLVKRSPLLRRKYRGRIKACSTPGVNRSIMQGGGLSHFTLLNTFNAIHNKYSDKTETNIALNLMAREDQSLLFNKELVYWLEEKDVCNNKRGFTAAQAIERLQHIGVLDKHSEYDYSEGVAREAIVKKKRNVSRICIEILRYYIDTDMYDLITDINYAYEIEDNTIYWKDDEYKQRISHGIAQEYYLSRDIAMYRRKNMAFRSAHEFKGLQKHYGMTYEFIEKVTNTISPGTNQARRSKIINELCRVYNIPLKQVYEEEIQTRIEIEELHKECLELPLCKNSYSEERVETTPIKDIYESSPPEDISTTPCSPVVTPDIAPVSSLLPVPCDDLCSLRDLATSITVEEFHAINLAFNDSLSCGLNSYLPKDLSDVRQQTIMLSNGCLPFEYKLLSPASPRLYSSQVDNLFYCRKEMRLAAMEGLGFMDVDLQNCHAEFVLALWGDRLPTIKECMDKGSLWSYYEEYFTSKNLPFHKGFIKALHHATFLTGGKRAYRQAWHRYNNQHPNAPISQNEYESITTAFISSPICKELKALFTQLKKEWVGKVLTVPTGESFLVEDTNWALLSNIRNGKKGYKHMSESEAEGNFPTALSALLQSLEVSLMSYLIVRCQALFVPILWQHDGLTIKALYSNTIELMQVAVNEFCDKYLQGKRYLTLTVEHL